MEKPLNFLGIISGGKDSIFSIVSLIKRGHNLVALANLKPERNLEELDSYMYQSVGTEQTALIAESMGKPFIQKTIRNKPQNINLEYKETTEDEVEHLFELIKEAKEKFPEIEAVSTGAIQSTY